MNKLLGIALLISLLSGPAVASEWEDTKPSQRWHYGLGIGQSVLAYNDNNIAANFTTATTSSALTPDDFTFKFFGAYRLDPFLALEFGISELGTTVATTNGSSTPLFSTYTSFVDLKMARPYNDRAAMFGKLGTHFWMLGPGRSTKLLEGTDLSIGAGLEFKLYGDGGRMIRIEWNRYLFDNIYLDRVDTFMLSLVFKP